MRAIFWAALLIAWLVCSAWFWVTIFGLTLQGWGMAESHSVIASAIILGILLLLLVGWLGATRTIVKEFINRL